MFDVIMLGVLGQGPALEDQLQVSIPFDDNFFDCSIFNATSCNGICRLLMNQVNV